MESKPYRVLHVVAHLGRGGAETMIMNHYRKIDRSVIQFDFLVNYPQRGEYEDEVEALGGRIFRSMPIRPWTYPKYFKFLDDFFANHPEFIAVHSHIQDNSGFVLKYAAKHNIKCRIANSHVANFTINYKYPFFLFAKYFLNKYVSQRFACGNSAGLFMHGQNKFHVLHNAIDIQKFSYNETIRKAKREELGIFDDQFVIGNVARFHPQKNHKFLLRIFADVLKISPESILLLCGSGSETKIREIKELANTLNISSNIKFLGSRSDIPELMQAFDMILFPSLFEGLPVSIIEAQAAGLPCVLSDTIDEETAETNLVEFLPLSLSSSEWAKHVVSKKGLSRTNTEDILRNAGYDVTQNVKWLTSFYLSHK